MEALEMKMSTDDERPRGLKDPKPVARALPQRKKACV